MAQQLVGRDGRVWDPYTDPETGALWWWCEATGEAEHAAPETVEGALERELAELEAQARDVEARRREAAARPASSASRFDVGF